MLYINHDDARICLRCGVIHDVATEQAYGKGVCPQCTMKECVTMQTYIVVMTTKQEVSCGG